MRFRRLREPPRRNLQGVLFHMKRSIAFAFILAAGLALSATAQTAAPASTPAPAVAKVAVIAFQAAVAQTNEFQRNYGDLQKKYEPKRDQLGTLNTQIETLTKELQSPTISDAEKSSKAASLDAKKKQLDRDSQDAQSDFQNDMQEMFKGVAAKVYDVMTEYAQKQGYTLILDASQEQNPVLFAVDSVNITKPVLDAYNVKSGVPAPPAGSAAPKPAAAAPSHPATPSAPRPAASTAHPATTSH